MIPEKAGTYKAKVQNEGTCIGIIFNAAISYEILSLRDPKMLLGENVETGELFMSFTNTDGVPLFDQRKTAKGNSPTVRVNSVLPRRWLSNKLDLDGNAELVLEKVEASAERLLYKLVGCYKVTYVDLTKQLTKTTTTTVES